MVLTVVSLFTGAMGLDLGFEQEGFEVRVCVEKDQQALETIKANRPLIPCIPHDIHKVKTEEILAKARLGVGEATVLTGAPPCEPFSTAGKRNGPQDGRAEAIFEFIRIVREARPQYFVFEEVPGLLSAAKRHISFYERIDMNADDLAPDERLGSFFAEVMAAFQETGYVLSCDLETAKLSVLNAADFGIAQKRKRFILVGVRDGPPVGPPSPTCTEWLTLEGALSSIHDPVPEYKEFPQSWGQYLPLVPPGGCWRDLPEELHRVVLGGAYDDPDNPRTKGKKGGRTGYMRRLSWRAPAPTLTDSPTAKSSCLCHPDGTRPLSVKEYAALQGFPPEMIFCGSTSTKYRLIGQATPTSMARAIARVILCHHRINTDKEKGTLTSKT
jgi:DNA (cytosine-5)-methyltransferase 1